MNTTRIAFITTGLSAVIALAGCSSVGPDYQAPTASVGNTWREAEDARFSSTSPESLRWWQALEDPVLDHLITRAMEQGPDRREAMARLREARALRGVSAADRFPTVDAAAGYRRMRESEYTPFGSQAPGDTDLYTAGLDASWELDLWGRVRRAVEAADADLAATAEDTRGVFLAVAAETALNYVELRAFQRRVAIARTNVELQEQTLALVQARYDAGFVSARDLAQASTNVAVTRSRVPTMEAGERAAENRLAVLVGVAPGTLSGELDASRAIPVPPVTAAIGVPADVVRNRPDIRRAERALAAEHARVGVAVGDLYPRLALAGSIGVAAGDSSDLFRSGSELFGVGPSVRWNFFDGARLRRRVEAQNARVEQAFVRWERAVLVGLEESETAMTSYLREQTRRRELQEGAAQARRAVELAQLEYREGQSDFQTVLDSERALAELEDELARTEAGIATQFVVLHKALGSG
ncbi:MAG: efflux transporter outer membrane subunit [Opitutaceae bacterium]|nr:efflux transporter outer membrane subunit [Opitutaceae bacterium]